MPVSLTSIILVKKIPMWKKTCVYKVILHLYNIISYTS